MKNKLQSLPYRKHHAGVEKVEKNVVKISAYLGGAAGTFSRVAMPPLRLCGEIEGL
jgi:hypothetical protein